MALNFKDRKEIISLMLRADDYKETVTLINYFEKIKIGRNPMSLNADEFEKILKWKLRRQYWRGHERRRRNTDEIIQKVTKLAFEIKHDDEDYETELKLKILSSLDGVEKPIASAILALVYPDKFAVIDYRGWKQLFDEKKSTYTTKDYLKYLKIIKELSAKFRLHPQQIDMAIWQYDVESNGNP